MHNLEKKAKSFYDRDYKGKLGDYNEKARAFEKAEQEFTQDTTAHEQLKAEIESETLKAYEEALENSSSLG